MEKPVLFLLLATSLSLADNDKVTFLETTTEKVGGRLGLLGSQLGLPPVPGAEDRSPVQVVCGCVPSQFCSPRNPHDGSGVIDIRIVTKPPVGVFCAQGEVYCCPNNPGGTRPMRCGTRTEIPVQNTIVNQGQAKFGEFPWEALILGVGNDYIGGGVLINNINVLTTAHKVAPYQQGKGLKVRMGEWNAKENTEPFKYQEFGILQAFIHPEFNKDNLHNDVAILRLSEPVPLGRFPHINTACLPPPNTDFTGQRCWVSGWGKDAFGPEGNYQNIQKKIDVPVLQIDDCEEKLRGTRLTQYFQLDRKSFVCAGGEPGKDACTGDGGSPLVCNANNQFYIIGMVAWGIGCAEPGIPGVYVNVANYADWIQQQIRS